VPVTVPGVDDDPARPARDLGRQAAYDRQAARLVEMFAENFAQYEAHIDDDVPSHEHEKSP
jgi:phosphoenolpyruvate carboxykinase (ATP)